MINLPNIADSLSKQSKLRPDAPAIHLSANTISFRQLDLLVWRASMFLHNHSVRANDVVGLALRRELDVLVTMLACARIGATVLPIPKNSPLIARDRILEEGKAQVLLTDVLDYKNDQARNIVIDIARLAQTSIEIHSQIRAANPTAPWLIITGSGSTGRPKMIAVSHAVCLARMSLYSSSINTSLADRVAWLSHLDFPSTKNQCLNALFSGASIAFFEDANLEPIEFCRRFNISILYAAGNRLESIIAAQTSDAINVLGSLRALIVAGATVSDPLRERVRRTLTENLVVRYGTTETGPVADALAPDVYTEPGTLGYPLKGVRIKIVSPQGEVLRPTELGLVCIQSAGMVHQYLDDDVASQRAFKGQWFLPGDLGKITPAGQLIYCGRADHMMNMGGVNIYPAEIESVIANHHGVRDAAAIPLKSSTLQDLPVCAVALHPHVPVTEDELLNYIYQRLGMRSPVRVFILDKIPRTEQGKLIRTQLITDIVRRLHR